MDKIYINNKPIILSDKVIKSSEYKLYTYGAISIPEILHKLKFSRLKGVVLFHPDIDELWYDFRNYFEVITAAGGMVTDENGHYLFIKRNNFWDLPKGKQEDGETPEQTAVREVEEECGISQIEVNSFIKKTFHIYMEDYKEKLKCTYWYAMTYKGSRLPVPQSEEGITDARFIARQDINSMYSKMYKNIEELVINYLNTKDEDSTDQRTKKSAG